MIPQDIIRRVITAHNNAVKAAQRLEAATPGTRAKETCWLRYQNAEHRFEAAMAALVDAAK